MATARVLLVHGAATTPAVWDRLIPLLRRPDAGGLEIVAPLRPSSGDLATEIAALADMARGAVVVGVSGGATLGLALLSSDVRLAGAVLHEPAVGALVPGLLDQVAAAYSAGGVPAFAEALYGPSWSPEMAPGDPDAVGRDLSMFRRFEPTELAGGQGPATTTVGGASPAARHEAAHALTHRFGLPARVLPGSRHFVQWDNPEALAAVVRDVVRAAGGA